MATIIETLGSTYRKAGARMLIAGNGELNSLVGGGCFELDLVEQTCSVFETGKPKTVFYDIRSPGNVVLGPRLMIWTPLTPWCYKSTEIFLPA